MLPPSKTLITSTTRKILRDNGISPQFSNTQVDDALQYAQEQLALALGRTKAIFTPTLNADAQGNTLAIPDTVFKVLSSM